MFSVPIFCIVCDLVAAPVLDFVTLGRVVLTLAILTNSGCLKGRPYFEPNNYKWRRNPKKSNQEYKILHLTPYNNAGNLLLQLQVEEWNNRCCFSRMFLNFLESEEMKKRGEMFPNVISSSR